MIEFSSAAAQRDTVTPEKNTPSKPLEVLLLEKNRCECSFLPAYLLTSVCVCVCVYLHSSLLTCLCVYVHSLLACFVCVCVRTLPACLCVCVCMHTPCLLTCTLKNSYFCYTISCLCAHIFCLLHSCSNRLQH